MQPGALSQKNYKAAVVIYTYAGDADILPVCLRAVRRALSDMPVLVVEDEEHPLPEQVQAHVDALRLQGVRRVQSSYPRHGNLRGGLCIQGMLLDMLHSLRVTSADIVVKIDCDTLLLGTDWLDKFAADEDKLYTGSTRPGTWYSGICYAVKYPLLRRISRAVNLLPISDDACEDVVIGSLAAVLSPPDSVMICEPQSPANLTGRWSAYNYAAAMSPELYARRYDVLTAGNYYQYDLPRSVRAEVMESILQAHIALHHC